MLSVFFWGPYDGALTNVQGAVFYPLLDTLGILIPDSKLRQILSEAAQLFHTPLYHTVSLTSYK
jgi:hypothetical protein